MTPSSDQVSPHDSRVPWSTRLAGDAHLTLRDRLSISWQRALRWEFWPAWLFYLPIVGWILWLGVRFRSPTLFTAANPIMEAGGVVGERKYVVLDALQNQAPELVAETLLLVAGSSVARIRQAEAFAARVGYPVVLKPDIGQRGRGVFVAGNAAEIREYLVHFGDDVLVQRHVEGEEYGVFVARRPGETRPRILSIVRKTFPRITGDGRSSIAQLILADERTRLSAQIFFSRLAGRLEETLPVGEQLKLVELGSHCRGSLFLNAMTEQSEALVDTLTRLMDAVPGYDFGRIDLRVLPGAKLASGDGIKVLELNGVTSESAHIYHPGTPLSAGYRAMFAQWSEAFEVGAERARGGGQTTSPLALLRQFRDDLRRGRSWF